MNSTPLSSNDDLMAQIQDRCILNMAHPSFIPIGARGGCGIDRRKEGAMTSRKLVKKLVNVAADIKKGVCNLMPNGGRDCTRLGAVYAINGYPISGKDGLVGIRLVTSEEFDEENERWEESYEDIRFSKLEKQILCRAGIA